MDLIPRPVPGRQGQPREAGAEGGRRVGHGGMEGGGG